MASIMDDFDSTSHNLFVEEDKIYRMKLPAFCIEFGSKTGKQLFLESMSSGYMECFFNLSAQFRTQDEINFCGVTTLVVVLNALSVDPGRVWKKPYRWYDESMLGDCITYYKQFGITFAQFVCLAKSNFLSVEAVYANDNINVDEVREVVRRCTSKDDTVLVVSYSRGGLDQSGEGHFSPVGGYHPGRDLVLVLDVARFKYPPHWVPLTTLVAAMKEIDQETGKPRGYMILQNTQVLMTGDIGDPADQPKAVI